MINKKQKYLIVVLSLVLGSLILLCRSYYLNKHIKENNDSTTAIKYNEQEQNTLA